MQRVVGGQLLLINRSRRPPSHHSLLSVGRSKAKGEHHQRPQANVVCSKLSPRAVCTARCCFGNHTVTMPNTTLLYAPATRWAQLQYPGDRGTHQWVRWASMRKMKGATGPQASTAWCCAMAAGHRNAMQTVVATLMTSSTTCTCWDQ